MKTKDELNIFMAKAMGWHRQKKNSLIWMTEEGKLTGFNYLNVWNSTEDLNHAKLCLDRWHSRSTCNLSSITRNGKKYSVILDDANFILGMAHDENMALAICEAIQEAMETK